jgi:hypothetical protein
MDREEAFYIFTTAPRPSLGPTQPPTKWVAGDLSSGVMWPGHEADHSPPSSAPFPIHLHGMVFNKHRINFMAWYLVKHRDNFTFTLYPILVLFLGS